MQLRWPLIFFAQGCLVRAFYSVNAALAALVPCRHGGTHPRSSMIFFCYNFCGSVRLRSLAYICHPRNKSSASPAPSPRF